MATIAMPASLTDPEDLVLPTLEKEGSEASFESTTSSGRLNDVEALLPETTEEEKPSTGNKGGRLLVWMVANTFATIAIVFINKSLFEDFRYAQSSFAAFHFTVTASLLFVLSKPKHGFFEVKRARVVEILPLAAAMCLNIILPNLSLAYSSVSFYQIVRVLLTPLVAAINFLIYKSTIPQMAVYTLFPVCAGVGIVTYYDSSSNRDETGKQTTPLGVIFAFLGVVASSLYTVWIGTYHKKLSMNSMQLLFNQAPLSVLLLAYAIPWTDSFPIWRDVTLSKWVLILLSGLCACIINISQFFIVAEAGAVSSTVVGHVKTCSIVMLGWIQSGKSVSDRSIFGVVFAIGGILAYTAVMQTNKSK